MLLLLASLCFGGRDLQGWPAGSQLQTCTGDLVANLGLIMLHVDPGSPTSAVHDINQHFKIRFLLKFSIENLV